MTDVEKRVKENIMYHRDRLGLKDADIAKACGVVKSTVSFWVNGKNSVSLESVAKLCDLFGITADELIFGTRQ